DRRNAAEHAREGRVGVADRLARAGGGFGEQAPAGIDLRVPMGLVVRLVPDHRGFDHALTFYRLGLSIWDGWNDCVSSTAIGLRALPVIPGRRWPLAAGGEGDPAWRCCRAATLLCTLQGAAARRHPYAGSPSPPPCRAPAGDDKVGAGPSHPA